MRNNILIGADLVPTKSNFDLFINGDTRTLLGEDLFDIWNRAAVRVFNLETPICDDLTPIDKYGPNLAAPTSTFAGIKALLPDVVCLSNNHILDQGTQGLESTISLLKENSISYIGAGYNLKDANNYKIITVNNKKVCFYGVCEHEFSVATDNSAGANPFDCLETPDYVDYLKGLCDYLIVLYHGGKEHYRYPTPYLQKVCRKMVDKGADIVIVQHTHCVGAYEEYRGATIVYGQGNFIFDHNKREEWQSSLIVQVDIQDNGLQLDYVPIIKNSNKILLALKDISEEILSAFFYRSKRIQEEDFVMKNYIEFAKQNLVNYERAMLGRKNNFIFKLITKLTKGKNISRIYDKRSRLIIRNFIECEAHRELILRGLMDE